MNYKFYTKKIDTTGRIYFMTEVEKDFAVLENFDFTDNNKIEIQEIIDGVKSTDNTEEEYRWANEDIMLISNKHAVFFIDLLSTRGGGNKIKEKQDLDLTHDEFIKFMEDFKKFIENENEK